MFVKEELEYINSLLDGVESPMAKQIKEKIFKLTEETGQCVWSFYWDCGRSGVVEGTFIATKQEIKNSIGKQVYFGEILGKHSEVYGVLEKCDLELVSDDPVIVSTYNTSGYNPLGYITYICDECGDSYEECDMYSTLKDNCICTYCYDEKIKLGDEK